MKEKILKAIDKGLMNVLSTDIEDHDIDFNHGNIDNEYVPEVSLEELYEMFQKDNDSIFDIKYNTKNAVSLILDNDEEISLSEYEPDMSVLFVKMSNNKLKANGNEILIYAEGWHKVNNYAPKEWSASYTQMQDGRYLICGEKEAAADYDGYLTCKRIMMNKKSKKLPAIEYCDITVNVTYKGYLPSAGQMKMILDYIDMLNYIFYVIGTEEIPLEKNGSEINWWTSSEKSRQDAWYVSKQYLKSFNKSGVFYAVMPIFKKIR